MMTDRQVRTEMARLDKIVGRARQRFFKGAEKAPSGESVDWNNPLDELIAREEECTRDAAFASIESLLSEGAELPLVFLEKVKEAVRVEFEQFEATLLQWIFAEGPHPLEVIRRLFAYAKMRDARLLWNMGFRDLGKLLNESHGSPALRCQLLFGETPAAWKKDKAAREAMAAAQLGNTNRNGGKKLNGRRREEFNNNGALNGHSHSQK